MTPQRKTLPYPARGSIEAVSFSFARFYGTIFVDHTDLGVDRVCPAAR